MSLAVVLEKIVPGASVVDLCKLGDSTIEEKVSKMFSKKVRTVFYQADD